MRSPYDGSCNFTVCTFTQKKLLEILGLLEEQNLDIFLISGTWLKPVDIFKIPNYGTIRPDRLTDRCALFLASLRRPLCGLLCMVSPLHCLLDYAFASRDFVVGDYRWIFSGNLPTLQPETIMPKNSSGDRWRRTFCGKTFFDFVQGSGVTVHSQRNPTFYVSATGQASPISPWVRIWSWTSARTPVVQGRGLSRSSGMRVDGGRRLPMAYDADLTSE